MSARSSANAVERRLAKRNIHAATATGARRRWAALNSVAAELKALPEAAMEAAIGRLHDLAAELNQINAGRREVGL